MDKLERETAAALRRFCRDESHPLRFNFADRLALLESVAPDVMWELIDTMITREKTFSVLEMVVSSLNRLSRASAPQMMARLRTITQQATQAADAENRIHETIAHTYLFLFLRTGDPECERYVTELIETCDSERGSKAIGPQLHACREGGWLTAEEASTAAPQADVMRARVWRFFSQLLTTAQRKLTEHRTELARLHAAGQIEFEEAKAVRTKIERTLRLVDGIGAQLFFASGDHDAKTNRDTGRLTARQLRQFWSDAAPLFSALAAEPHPHTANQIVETLHHLLPCAPREIFLLACKSIMSSSE
ncbi:MAG: hypothetical protein ABL897_10820, partial [Hyphomicrobium sp.]